MSRVVQHIYRGKSRDRAWCGRYVGFHNPKPAVIEDDFIGRREMGLLASICRTCQRSYQAFERGGA